MVRKTRLQPDGINTTQTTGTIGPRAGGFTLIEVMVIVIVIGVLAALIVPQFFSRVGQAKAGVARGNLAIIESAIQTFNLDYNRFPETLDDLVQRPTDIETAAWNPPPLKQKNLVDPWGRPWVYRYPGQEGVFDLLSYGADGQPGGDGENADVVNW